MRYFSTFSGIGGFELGIQLAYDMGVKSTDEKSEQAESEVQQRGKRATVEVGLRVLPTDRRRIRPVCIGFSEIDKYATQIYQKHFPNHKNYGDITKIDETSLPDFSLLVGGFPCQAFSIAGKRGGFEDTRGTMFFELARIIRAKQPRLLLLENVKGLLSHDQGRTFTTIISTLDELGYDLEWQVLNSKNHGVPQNRERVFIIGHSRGSSRPEVFPFGEADETNNENRRDVKVIARGGLQKNAAKMEEQSPALTEAMGQGGGHTPIIQQLNQPTHSNDRVYGTDGVSPTLNTMQGGNRQPFIPEDSKIRRLTPTECERLQGFPDGWTEGLSDSQRYKTLGNAVTVNVIKDICERLL